MKTFPTEFNTEKDKKTGAKLVWIIQMVIGGSTYTFSDNAFTIAPWSLSTVPIVGNWGRLREDITGGLNETKIADLDFTLINDPNAAPGIIELVTENTIEDSPVSVFQWYRGIVDEPQMMFQGRVRDARINGTTSVAFSLQDNSVRLENTFFGSKINYTDYPYAWKDDVGKVAPIVFGSVIESPSISITNGSRDTASDVYLTVALGFGTAYTIVTVTLSDTSKLAVGMYFRFGNSNTSRGMEMFRIVSIVSSTQITAVRGQGYNNKVSEGLVLWSSDPNICTHPVFTPEAPQYQALHVFFDYVPPTPYSGKLHTAITDTVSTTIYIDVTDVGYGVPAAGETIQIDDEKILLGTKVVDSTYQWHFTGCTRGYSGTTKTTHAVDALIQDITKNYHAGQAGLPANAFLAADHAVDSIAKVWCKYNQLKVDITSLCNLFTGNSGSELSPFNGKAVAQIIDEQSVLDLINVTIDNTLDVTQGMHSHSSASSTVAVPFNNLVPVSGSWLISYANVIDGNIMTAGITSVASTRAVISRAGGYSGSGSPTQIRLVATMGDTSDPSNNGGGTFEMFVPGVFGSGYIHFNDGSTKSTQYSAWLPLSNWGDIASITVNFTGNATYPRAKVWDVSFEVQSSALASPSPADGVTMTGSLTVSGGTFAGPITGEMVLVDMTRAITPVDACSEILTAAGLGSCSLVGSLPGSYTINGLVNEYRTSQFWLNYIALQLRCYFRTANGVNKLIFRESVLSSVKTIDAIKTSGGDLSLTRSKTDLYDLINKINISFNRDWTKARGNADSYKGISSASDSASIAVYGTRERPDLFLFDFVTDQSHADDLRDFYLTRYKDRHWIHEFNAFTDQSELEFADIVTLDFLNGEVGEVTEVQLSPGDASRLDSIGLRVVV